MADQSKTEKATPKKRKDERKKGNVLLSQDIVSVATLLGSYAGLLIMASTLVDQLSRFMKFCIAEVSSANGSNVTSIGVETEAQAIMVVIKTVGPLLALTAILAIVATFAQTKFLVATDRIKPKFSHISPMQGFKRLFSLRNVIEALKGIVKIAILIVLIYTCIKGMFPNLVKYLYVDIGEASGNLYSEAMKMFRSIIVAFIVIAAADFLYQRWDFEKNLKMTKQEVKEEYKQLEGDPQIKSKIREVQRKMSMGRMMQQVPESDVVIRNPTHFAVALRYRPKQDNAPVVMALGQDQVALRIVKTAEEHNIPLIENPPLARALYANTQLNQEIPPEFYSEVAEVLVYIFRLNDNKEIINA